MYITLVRVISLSNTYIDHCYDEGVLNADVYKNSCQEIVMNALEGINGTIFMYGQTGAGKTYTMLGDYSTDINTTTNQV